MCCWKFLYFQARGSPLAVSSVRVVQLQFVCSCVCAPNQQRRGVHDLCPTQARAALVLKVHMGEGRRVLPRGWHQCCADPAR